MAEQIETEPKGRQMRLPARQMEQLDRWSVPVMANMLWALMSLLVLTIPLAIAGLMGVMFRWTEGQSPQVFHVFFNTIRRTWKKCYAIAAIDLVVGGLVLLNLMIFGVMEMDNVIAFLSRSITLFVAIMLLLVNIYAWTLVSVWDVSLRHLLTSSVKLVFLQPIRSLILGAIIAAIAVFSTVLPVAIFIVATGAVIGYIASRGTSSVLDRYVSPQDFKWIELD